MGPEVVVGVALYMRSYYSVAFKKGLVVGCITLLTLYLASGMWLMVIVQVLLGESHYAQRSAKQTVEILDRRSNFLDQKISSTKAQIADLQAESAFMTSTAEEAKVSSCRDIHF